MLVIGSGPAAVAVVEQLYATSNATIGVLERGGILTTTHVSNMLGEPPGGRLVSPVNRRERFIRAHERFEWEGSFKGHGMMMAALGGRGIVAGAQLRRFYPDDFTIWRDALWPRWAVEELGPYYTRAEVRRHVRPGDCDGAAQTWVLGQLNPLHAAPPPWGVDSPTVRNLNAGEGYDSSVSRLWKTLIDDHETAFDGTRSRRLLVATHAYATALEAKEGRVTGVICRDGSDERAGSRKTHLKARIVVLAANPVESARLMLNSKLGNRYTGLYLAEHMYLRHSVSIAPPVEIGDIHGLAVRVVVPPQSSMHNDRFQIEVLGEEDPANPGYLLLRITAEVAMEADPRNRVTLAIEDDGTPMCDGWGVQRARTTVLDLRRRPEDEVRVEVAVGRMWEIARRLGVSREEFEKGASRAAAEEGASQQATERFKILPLPAGRSHHEAGTLRMGGDKDAAVTDTDCRVYGIENLYVADASLFPCVGAANPMLTVTAIGYRLAEHIAGVLAGGTARTARHASANTI